jgi:ABC-type transport system substrate-binding protein
MFTLPEMPAHAQGYSQAQAILAEDLPAIPLYWHYKVMLTRPDFCGVSLDASSLETLWNIEVFNYGGDCQ